MEKRDNHNVKGIDYWFGYSFSLDPKEWLLRKTFSVVFLCNELHFEEQDGRNGVNI